MTSLSSNHIRRSVISGTAAIVAILSLAACGSPSGTSDGAAAASGGSSSDASAPASGTFPVTIKHVYGTTTIKSQPKRIVTVGWGHSR